MVTQKAKLPKEVREEWEKALVRAYFDQAPSGTVVDIGANEPVSAFSQSWHLENQLGWRAILVEPNPEFAQRARTQRPNALTFECACCATEAEVTLYIPKGADGAEIALHAAIGKNLDSHSYSSFRELRVRGRPLNHILEEARIRHIDLLSIDVEGAEMEVLRGGDLAKYKPAPILLEDKHFNLHKHRHLRRHGYRLCKRTGLNCWYVPKDAKRPPQSFREKVRLFKRLYISIWRKKLCYLMRRNR